MIIATIVAVGGDGDSAAAVSSDRAAADSILVSAVM